MKTCTKCGVLKDELEFYLHRKGTSRHSSCKTCHKDYMKSYRQTKEGSERIKAARKVWDQKNPEKRRAALDSWHKNNPEWKKITGPQYQRKYKYGISEIKFQAMLREQAGCCAICGDEFSKAVPMLHACVDHCHATGKIRGLLCKSCNLGIGRLKDSPIRLQKAISYLENFS